MNVSKLPGRPRDDALKLAIRHARPEQGGDAWPQRRDHRAAMRPAEATARAAHCVSSAARDGRRAGVQAKLIEDIVKTRAGHEEVGIAGSRWILPVLSQAADEGVAGAADATYTVASQSTDPSYGYWISLGWTSLGEYREKSSRTRSHHMFGGVTQWFYEHLAGMRPLEPGYRRIAFNPTVPPASNMRRHLMTACAAGSRRHGARAARCRPWM